MQPTPKLRRRPWRCRKCKNLLAGKTIRKVVVVPKKLVNIVAA